MAALGLHAARGLSLVGVSAPHCGGFSSCGVWALGAWASVVVAHRLSCPVARGIFQDQGLSPLSPALQADSLLLDHREAHPIYCLQPTCGVKTESFEM